MSEFWETTYRNNDKMWGEKPTDNAAVVLKLLQNHAITSVLIPGFGYGRNAKVFYENGIDVTGIEISKSAIKRARKYFTDEVTIHLGSVTAMPFDTKNYQSIYCYSLIHLLVKTDRQKLIQDCYTQLKHKGLMIFVALSNTDKRFGVGEKVDTNTYRSPHGLRLFFYDKISIEEEFGNYNIVSAKEINEPEKNPTEKHWMIICERKAVENDEAI